MKRKEQKKIIKNAASIQTKELEARGVHMDMQTSWAAQELTAKYSNLDDMARFQQKQLQEKEQKLLQLYDQQQQRAYQVVQRGSPGSNGSSYGSSVSQHTVTKTSTSSHTTSTSQGGKVRQMFDERRQTTVKGIDRSYPLEPLENKPRKQTNGNVQKNGNTSVNRHSVTVKRVARADVNSNLNAGKPIVSYHEEITRESFGPLSGPRQPDDDEFGNENHVSQYANGNHQNEIQIEEVLDEDTVERNRMMAKLHLMEYDETLKHRIKNDLESEEFPENFIEDVPDKLPKQSMSKKLSQAEARLERFRNANAKRISNATKNTSSSQVPKKRTETVLPGKVASSKGKTRNASERFEEMQSSSSSERTVKRKNYYEDPDRSGTYGIDSKSQFARLSSESSSNAGFRRRSPRLFCQESEEAATIYAVDPKTGERAKATGRSSSDFSRDRSRSGSPRFFYKESEKSAANFAIDSETIAKSSSDYLKDRISRSGSPRFFCRESEKSATTYAIDAKTGLGSKTTRRLSPDFSSDRSRSGSPKLFGNDSKKSATTYAIDSKDIARSSPDHLKERRSRSGSPRFFCREDEKSATTFAIDAKTGLGSKTTRRLSPAFSSDRSRSGSPKLFGNDSKKSATTYTIDSKDIARSSPDHLKERRSRSGSPRFFCREDEKSATTFAIDAKTELGSKITRRLSPDFSSDRSRSGSPKLFGNDSKKSATTYTIDSKDIARSSPDHLKERRSRSGSPRFFCREDEKSATTFAIDAKTELGSKITRRLSPDFSSDRSRSGRPKLFGNDSKKSATTYAIDSKDIARSSPDHLKERRSRSGSPRFFCWEDEKAATTYAIDAKTELGSKITKRMSPDFSSDRSRSGSPRFFGKDSEKSTVNYAIAPKNMGSSSPNFTRVPRSRSGSHKIFGKDSEKSATTYASDSKGIERSSPNYLKDRRSRSGSPRFFFQESEKSATTYAIDSKTGPGSKATTRLSPDFSGDRSRSGSPRFFCKESDKSATTYAIDSKSKKKLVTDLSKNRCIVEIEPDSEFINKSSRKSSVTIDDTVDRYIKDHDLDKVRTPSPTESLKFYTGQVKIVGNIDSKSTRSVSTNIFGRLTKDRSSSPQFLHKQSRKTYPISATSTKRREFISKSPDKIHDIPKNHDHSKISSRKYDFSHSRAATSKSPDFAKTLRKSNASPQFFSDRSATIMFVTPETITKTRTGYSKQVKKARSPTLSINKADVRNKIIDSNRRKSIEDIEESSKQKIRNSVSRYFSEQCEKALRNEETRAKNSAEKSQVARNTDVYRVSSPVSLRHMKAVSPVNKSPQLYRESPGKFVATNVDRSRSGTPEFFCYETGEMATTVSLKPRPGISPEPVRSESRLSKSSDTATSIKNVNDSSRNSSPSGTQYMTDKDKRILKIFPSKSEQPKCLKHSKSPKSTNKFISSKGKSYKNSDVFNVDRDRRSVSSNRRSRPSASPEFFCYETDKMATTLSLKPRPSTDLREHAKSPEPLRSESRLSKSSDMSIKNINTSRSSSPVLSQYLADTGIKTSGHYSSKNDRPKSSKDLLRKRTKSPVSTSNFSKGKSLNSSAVLNINKDKDTKAVGDNRRSRPSASPEFFCYETDKMATTVSLKPRPSTDLREHVKSPEPLRSESRLSKSSDMSIKNINTSRSSSPILSQYLADTGIKTSGHFFSKNDRPKSSKDLLRKRTKSPVSTSTFAKGKSFKTSDVLNINKDKDTKTIGANRRSRPSASPEFFCYETDKMATTVSLKPRPSTDLREHAKSPEPLRSESRLSKSSDMSIKNINTSRSSSPVLSQYLIDPGRTTPGLFSSNNDRPKSSKDLLRKRTKSPVSNRNFSKGKSLNSSAVLNINKDKDTKAVGDNRRSRPSASPEFFCYETDKMATTVSLKPRTSTDLREHAKSSEPLRSESRLSKSSDMSIKNINTSRSSSPVLSQYLADPGRTTPGLCSSKHKPNSPNDVLHKHSKSPSTSTYTKGKSPKTSSVFNLPEDTKSNARSHNVSPSLHKGSPSPDFFCYETEKSATTVSLRSSSKSSKSSGFTNSVSKGRSSKSPEQLSKDSKGRRGSGNVLRSTRLVRDILKHQRNRENDSASWRDSVVSGRKERASSVGAVELKQRSKTGWNKNVVDRATTPTSKRKLPCETSPKSGISAEINSEIQNITMTDQQMMQNQIQLSGTYSKSSKTSSSSSRSDTFTNSLTKQVRNRRPPLDSTIFFSSKRDQRLIESGMEMNSFSEETPRLCGSIESVLLDKKQRALEDTVCPANPDESLRSEVQTTNLSRQPPTLGSIELVRKVMKSGTKAPGKTLETQEADEQEGIQRRPSNSVFGTIEVIYGESSKNYDRTDSVESALRRFDSIDTEAGVESIHGTLQESATEKRQTPVESRVESYGDDSSTISLKALDQDGNSPETERESLPTRLQRTSGTLVTSRARVLKKEEDRRRKKMIKITDQSEITGKVRPLNCRRRLFQDNDFETRNLRKIGSKSEATGLAKIGSRNTNKEPSTGMLESDLSLSVKQLRSIEDIRKSFGDISSDRDEARTKSAIASNSSSARSGKPRVSSSVACDKIGKESLAKRSENVGASRGSERFVKSATRFSRIVKSPSLDSTKANETTSRNRRSVLSPSKSPDTVTRRPSTELKASDTRSTKRTTPTKDSEPIGNRKTTTTTTTTRKSTDAVDGATVLENGLHLQDQTVETKYDNEPQTAKKTFVIDCKEQPLTENNGPLPRKLLLKKPSIEKQTPSTPMQASTSNPKSKMTLRAKPANVASSLSRSSASSKTGSNCTPDLLVPCKICGRSFAQDRVTLHEQICAKTGQKRRKLFDSVMSRVKGTELEKFVKKGCAKKQPEKPPEPKSNWRRKHEDFINAIRSAKQVQAHLAAGGKLSDLPPPPPSDTSDYIQCPHCGRKFNKAAAERHIPKCEHMLHNKPIHSRAPKPRR